VSRFQLQQSEALHAQKTCTDMALQVGNCPYCKMLRVVSVRSTRERESGRVVAEVTPSFWTSARVACTILPSGACDACSYSCCHSGMLYNAGDNEGVDGNAVWVSGRCFLLPTTETSRVANSAPNTFAPTISSFLTSDYRVSPIKTIDCHRRFAVSRTHQENPRSETLLEGHRLLF